MFENFVNWRKAENVDDILNFDFTEFDQVQAVYPHAYHKTDKLGRPVYIERLGMLNITALWEVTTEERMLKHYIQSYEILMKLRFPACQAVQGGKRYEGSLTLLDLTGGTMSQVNKQVYGLIKLCSKIGSDYYPEIMGNLLCINAPMLFNGVWAIVKGFLDEKTRRKI